MYALIHNNRVLSGPRNWDKAFFEFVLKRQKINYTFVSRKPTDELPFVINDDTKIYPVEVIRKNINDMIEYHRGPTWDIQESVAVATYEVVETPLEFAKANYKNLLADERYRKEVKGVKATVQDTEVTVDTSRDGRNIFVQKHSMMAESDTVNWKFPEGWLTLTKSELGQLITAGAAHIQDAFDWEKEISDQIDAETEVADLVKYKEIIKPEPEHNQGLAQND
jgi:hypothetical protein